MMGCMLPRLLVLGLSLTVGCVPRTAGAQIDAFHAKFEGDTDSHGVVGGGFCVRARAGSRRLNSSSVKRDTITHQRVDADTAYNWASITKTMTAIAILQLRDRGRLSLDDPAVRYVPELRQVHDAYGAIDDITIRHLLTHSAGFRNPTWPWDCDDAKNCDWQPFEPTKWAQVAAMLPYTHVAFKPGSRWSYSNLGYVFLGQIIERLSGDDFEVYIDKNILKPLGMTASYFDRAPYFLESHVAASYLRAGAKLTPQPFDFDTGITTSNSGLKAPITDMVKYARFLIGDPANPIYAIGVKAQFARRGVEGRAAGDRAEAVANAVHFRSAWRAADDGAWFLCDGNGRPQIHLSRWRPGRVFVGVADRSGGEEREHPGREYHGYRGAGGGRAASGVEHRARSAHRSAPDVARVC